MPNFVQSLKKTTAQYIAETVQTLQKRLIRNIVDRAKVATTKGLVNNVRVSGPLSSDYGDGDTSGYVFLNSSKFSKRLKDVIDNKNLEFMEQVFKISQDIVPIDKKYAQSKRVKFLDTGRKSINATIRSAKSAEDIEEYFGLEEFRRNVGYFDPLRKTGLDIGEVKFTRKSGWYEESQVDFIKEMLRGSNRATRKTRFIYNENTGTVIRKGLRSKSRVDTMLKLTDSPYLSNKGKGLTNRQPTGGYQELKNGGYLYYEGGKYIISYSAYDRTRPLSTFNYAALQHDNLRFKHMKGKEPLFLYRAFARNRRKWYDALANEVKKEFTNATK